jgi:hypothetical protein
VHPLAELRQQQLEGPNLTQREHQDASRLAAPFKIVDSDISPFRLEVASRIAATNSAAGLPADAPLPAADRARVRTEIDREFSSEPSARSDSGQSRGGFSEQTHARAGNLAVVGGCSDRCRGRPDDSDHGGHVVRLD